MRVVIPGGSGHLGRLLAGAWHASGHDVVVLSRRPAADPWRVVAWDAVHDGPWTREIDGADVVVNLAGRSVDCRYTPENRRAILESRVRSTEAVGRAISAATRPPSVWLQMSTATIYRHTLGAAHDEATGVIGGGEPDVPDTWRFSIEVARAWEEAAATVATPATRVVLLRTAMVMSATPGGAFATLRRLARSGLGGAVGGGRQYVSWIHETDFVRALQWLVDRPMHGAVNIAAPAPLPYADFMRELRRAVGMPVGLPATRWMVEIGTRVLGTESELVLKSRRVVPGRLLGDGFTFAFPEWASAARDLCRLAP
jgi:uncharacterized protein